MKIRKNRLRKIILEEISLVVKEQADSAGQSNTDKKISANKDEHLELLKLKSEEAKVAATAAKKRESDAARNIAKSKISNSQVTEAIVDKITNSIFKKIKKADDNAKRNTTAIHLNKE